MATGKSAFVVPDVIKLKPSEEAMLNKQADEDNK